MAGFGYVSKNKIVNELIVCGSEKNAFGTDQLPWDQLHASYYINAVGKYNRALRSGLMTISRKCVSGLNTLKITFHYSNKVLFVIFVKRVCENKIHHHCNFNV